MCFDNKCETLINEYSQVVIEITKLRNKAIAHTDRIIFSSEYSFKLTFQDIQDIHEYLDYLLDQLYDNVLGESYVSFTMDNGAEDAYKIIENYHHSK